MARKRRPRLSPAERAKLLLHRYKLHLEAFKRRGCDANDAHRHALREMGVGYFALVEARRLAGVKE